MTIRNIMIALGFEVDDKSVSNAEKTIDGLKSMAAKALGALGVAFSLQGLNEIAEEYGAINNQIRSATEGMGEQAEIQQQILKAANNSRTAYGDTAKFVGNLVQSNKDLFGSVDEAAQYAELTNKLFRSAGKSSEQVAEMQEALNQSFARGVVDTETMSRLLEEAPEAVKLLEKEVGASKEQFEEMASAGQITVADLKNAIVNNADEINRAFGNVNMTVSDALLNIRNQWGVWVAKINDQYKITDRLSRLLVTIFGKLMNWLDKAVAFVDKLADKLGGFENLLKLIAIAAGSIWLGLNAGKIMGFLGKIPGMLKGITSVLNPIHLKTMALVAVIALIALAIDDLIAFMNGDASIIGVFFEKMGIDSDVAREKIGAFINGAKELLGKLIDLLGKGFSAVKDFLGNIWSQNGDKIKNIIGDLIEIIGKIITILGKAFSAAKEFLGNFWEANGDRILSAIGSFVDGISGALSGLIEVFSGIIDFINSVFSGDWEGAWEAIKEIGVGIWNTISSLWEGFWDGIFSIFDGIIDNIKDGFQSFVDWLADKFSWVTDGLNKIKDAWNWLKDSPVGEFVGGVKDTVSNALDSAGDFLFGNPDNPQPATIAASAGGGNRTNNVNQNINIQNTFNGSDREMQQKGADMIGKAANDTFDEAAKGLATGR